MMRRYNVHRAGQWTPFLNWTWSRTGKAYDGDHGVYPFKCVATLVAWLTTRKESHPS